jgi:hypothetical protein
LGSAARWRTFFQSKLVRRGTRVAQVIIFFGVLTLITKHLADIGWDDIWTALPRTPWFYILIACAYVTLPVAEVFVYEKIWGVPMWRRLPVLFRKRVLNEGVMGYSGEAYLCLWAHRHTDLPGNKILSTVKDNNILSAVVSTSGALVLFFGFLVSGKLSDVTGGDVSNNWMLVGMLAVSGLWIPVVIRFRKRLIALPRRTVRSVLFIHVLRLVSAESLQVMYWMVVLPFVPLSSWLTFTAAQMLLTRVPLLPNKDLMLLGLGITLANVVNVPATAVTALFLAGGATIQFLHLIVFFVTTPIRIGKSEEVPAPTQIPS